MTKAGMVPSIVFDGQAYFTTAELGCRCDVCQGRGKLAEGFREKLLGLRLVFGDSMPLSSGSRCVAHNRAEGGTQGSYHIYENKVGTCAVDVIMRDSVKRGDLIELALSLGWRVGVNAGFVHLDRSPDYYPSEKRKVFLY